MHSIAGQEFGSMKKMLEEIWQKSGLASAVRFVKWRLENGELVAKTRRLRR